MAKSELARVNKYAESLRATLKFLNQQPSSGDVDIFKNVVEFLIEALDDLKRCVEEKKPIAVGMTCLAPEIVQAFGIHYYNYLLNFSLAFFMGLDELKGDFDEAERMGMTSDFCSAFRMLPYLTAKRLLPTPSMIIGSTHACDAMPMALQIIGEDKIWGKAPMFALDGPWIKDETGLDYFAGEVMRFISFLEEHTGQKLSLDRLREVIEESNRQVELWQESNDLRRSVPCPHPSAMPGMMFAVQQLFGDYTPKRTAWFRSVVADAEERVKAKKGIVEKEKIRVIWGDNEAVWTTELFSWLEQEHGAVTVMTLPGSCGYKLIDTSSLDSICRDMGARMMHHVPMIAHVLGPLDLYVDRLVRIIIDYKADCVFMPGHVGHKDIGVANNLMKEVCRDMNIPCLVLQSDLYDPRATSAESLKKPIEQFFETMGLG